MSSDPNLWGPGGQPIPGPPGPPGPAGPAPELGIGSVVPGTNPAVTITPAGEGAYTLSFVLPEGRQGPRGLPGAAATFTGITVDTLPPGSPATASITGLGPEYQLNLGIPRGATGLQGDVGPDGRATAIWAGPSIPPPDMGITGDYYIRAEPVATIYGPKPTDDSWQDAHEIVIQGPKGRDAENLRLSIGTVEPATTPAVTITGSFPDYALNFELVKGDRGDDGLDGQVVEVVGGTDISVDSTDPAAPVVSFTGSVGGQVDSVVAGTGISIDDTDPVNPVISTAGTIVAGDGIEVDPTDPVNPKVSVASAILTEVAKIPDIEDAIGDIGTALDLINGEVIP